MNIRSLILGFLALLVAGGAALTARTMMAGTSTPQTQAAAVAPPAPKTQVLVASKALPTGHILTADDLKWVNWPDNGVQESYYKTGEIERDGLAGKVLKNGLQPDQPLLNNQVVGPGERGFLAAVLTPGMRAVSVAVTETSGVSGFIFPGDRVDLILTHEVPNGNGLALRGAETILTNVRVLAIDQTSNDVEKVAKVVQTVTLEVPPRLVETISVMQRLGAVSLSLRSLTPGANETAAKNTDASPNPLALVPALPSDKERTLTVDRDVSTLVTKAKVSSGGTTDPLAALVGSMNGTAGPTRKPDLTISRGTANAEVDFLLKRQANGTAPSPQEVSPMAAAMAGALIGAKAAQTSPKE
jgi:pilus assembly protein CpaB